MATLIKEANPYALSDGSKIAVIGGGPTGSLFSIFSLKMAKMVGTGLQVTIFEPKDFTKNGPEGCNHCGGIISELLVQTFAVEGINLPDSVVQRGINSYRLHTNYGNVVIETPSAERTIATVYRGGGPSGIRGREMESFDKFLLSKSVEEGAMHRALKIDGVQYRSGKPVLFSGGKEVQDADLVVGAFGLNSATAKIFEGIGFGYKAPDTVTAAIAEIGMDSSNLAEQFGSSIHLFLLPIKAIQFAAIIPKETYITICILGKGVNARSLGVFLNHPVVRDVLPKEVPYEIKCRCLPKMNIRAPKIPFADRVVMCGDAGSTRLLKDGLGAAYIMGKAAARTAVFEGVGRPHLKAGYYPVYQSIITDNHYGAFLYKMIEFYRSWKILTRAMLNVVNEEQHSANSEKILSSILWDMFTGNELFKNVFFKSLKVRMHLDMWGGLFKALTIGGP